MKSSTLDRSESAFEIFEQYSAPLSTFLRNKAGVEEGMDLLSQVRLVFHERLSQLRDKKQIKPFLFQIARDELKKHWLAQHRNVMTEEFSEIQISGTNPESDFLNKERESILQECMYALPDQIVKRVALLRYGKGSPQAIIREKLKLSVDQVKKYIKKAEIRITDCVRRKMIL